MEKIIKFPLPKYKGCFDNEAVLKREPHCLCFQFNVDSNGYGPYGFDNDRAKKIISRSFDKLFFWDENKQELCNYFPKEIFKEGIYLCDSNDFVEVEKKNIASYRTQKRKNEFLLKQGKNVKETKDIPILFQVYKNGKFCADVLNKLMDDEVKFFIVQLFAPEARNSMILFDDSFFGKIETAAQRENVDFCHVNSVDNLKPW